jgi:hypothetical protein
MPFHSPANRFTTTSVTALLPRDRPYDLSELAVVGLLLRVSPTGTKSWLFRFKWKSHPSRIKIGSFPKVGIAQARERALAHRKDLDDGIDPRRSARPDIKPSTEIRRRQPRSADDEANAFAPAQSSPAAPDVHDPLLIPKPSDDDKHSVHFLAYEFVEFYVKPNREVPQEVIRILKKDVLPFFENRDARTVTSREVTDRLDAIVARGAPVMANRTAPIISQMFSFGVPARLSQPTR